MKHLLTLADCTGDEIRGLLALAARVKGDPEPWRRALDGQVLGMVFQKPSTRTRVSFEVGMLQLGGHAIFLSSSEIQLRRGETPEDTAKVLSRYCDGIMARVFSHRDVVALTAGSVPVINGLSNRYHPCQGLADMLTLDEHLGGLEGRVLAYVGDGSNVAHSLILAGGKLGLTVRVATPPSYAVDPRIVAMARDAGGDVEAGDDPLAAVAGADVVYTDVWTPMHREGIDEHAFDGFQVNDRLMSLAAPGARFMHCLPAHRGHEVTDAVMDSAASIVFDQAENRLHAQKAVLLHLMGGVSL